MASKQTGDKVSALAGRYASLQSSELIGLPISEAHQIAKDIRSMAASLLAQDEVRGLRKLWKKVTG